MEKKMETAIMENQMEKKMEIKWKLGLYMGYIGYILGSYRDNAKEKGTYCAILGYIWLS